MTDGYGSAGTGQAGAASRGGTVDTAKHEAGAVKDVAADGATEVAHTAKDEAKGVAREASAQAKDLYRQTRGELAEQASAQKERLASGLRQAGEDFSAMADGASSRGMATDVVGTVAQRLSDAATWLADREPADILDDVKRFARRRPVAFIAGAAIVGLIAGRLVRSLASSAHDDATDSPALTAGPGAEPSGERAVGSAALPPTAAAAGFSGDASATPTRAGGASDEFGTTPTASGDAPDAGPFDAAVLADDSLDGSSAAPATTPAGPDGFAAPDSSAGSAVPATPATPAKPAVPAATAAAAAPSAYPASPDDESAVIDDAPLYDAQTTQWHEPRPEDSDERRDTL